MAVLSQELLLYIPVSGAVRPQNQNEKVYSGSHRFLCATVPTNAGDEYFLSMKRDLFQQTAAASTRYIENNELNNKELFKVVLQIEWLATLWTGQ